jgi:hypothetical protein
MIELFITAVRTSNPTLHANVDIKRALTDNTTYCYFFFERDFLPILSAVNHQLQAPNLTMTFILSIAKNFKSMVTDMVLQDIEDKD